MNFDTILGSVDFLEYLRGKQATFLLAGSVTRTSEIPHILQSKNSTKLYLMPTLNAEFLCSKELKSLEKITKTSKNILKPVFITRAVHELKPFSNIEILDLGLELKPKINYFKVHKFDIKPSARIDDGAKINAMEIFQKGVEFGTNYESKDDYIILSESVISGDITAVATAKALGYKCDDFLSSSVEDVSRDIKNSTIETALKRIQLDDDVFTKLSKVSDNMLIFNAGFILGSTSKNLKVILAGGTQMATVLLIVNSILESMQGSVDSSNIALCTSKNKDNKNIKTLLEQLNFPINTYSSTFDSNELEDSVGYGAALCYASINGVNKKELVSKIDSFLGD